MPLAVDHVLAVVPVSDLDRADAWFETLLGRPADNRPMPTLVEWRLAGGGWLQVFVDPEHAGSGAVNLAVPDLDAAREEVAGRGLPVGDLVEANKGVRLTAFADPDGNTVSFIGGFRVEY